MDINMKHTSYMTILAVLLTAACAKENISEKPQPVLPENAVGFSGSMAARQQAGYAPGTRTVYEDAGDQINVSWAEGDKIGIFCSVGGATEASNVSYRNGVAGPSATFSPSGEDLILWKDEVSGHDFHAYYPYTETAGQADVHAVPVNLPAVQTVEQDGQSVLPGIGFMYASAEGQTKEQVGKENVRLTFHHLFPVLEVRIRASRISTIDAVIFRCNDETETVSFEGGSVDITADDVVPDTDNATAKSNEIRLENSRMTSLGEYTVFHMHVSPGHAGKTFSIIAEINGEEYPVAERTVPDTGLQGGETYVVSADVDVKEEDAEPIIDLSEDGTANCYYVTEPDMLYRFNATVKGNGEITEGIPEMELEIAPAKVIVLWYSRVQSGYGPWTYTEPPVDLGTMGLESDGYVYFRTPETFVPGNMVLAAISDDLGYDEIEADADRRIKNTEILWSWNLVFAEGYDPDDAANQIVKGGYMLMSRNLGAVIDPEDAMVGGSMNGVALASTAGNVYQWGRKDPFPGLADYMSYNHTYMTNLWFAPGFTPVTALQVGPYEAHGRITEGNIFANNSDDLCINLTGQSLPAADILAIETSAPYLWIRRDNFELILPDDGRGAWGNPDGTDPVGVKTIYDPCPPGWKVMSKAAWSAITENLTATAEMADIATGFNDAYRGAWFEGSWFPYTGGYTNHNVSGGPDGSPHTSYATYWLDTHDGMHGMFNGTGRKPGDRVPAVLQQYQGTGSSSIRCMKISAGQAMPEGGELDNLDRKPW